MTLESDNFKQKIVSMMQSWQVPGVALAVIQGDEILHMAGYGLADVENQTPIDVHTNFAIASVTKTFTALGAALLVDEGVLTWDKPIRQYFPEFKLADAYISDHITLRDMLSHRSGLPRHDFAWYNTAFTREELIHNMRHHKFSKGFREAWQYQNLMYVTVGYLCGKLTGQTWEDYIQSRIFEPLGLDRSCFDADAMRQLGNYALAYRIKREKGQADRLEKMDFYANAVMGPAGSIHSNLHDLTTWLKVHLNNGQHQGTSFISSGNLAPMHTPQIVMPADGINVALMNTTLFTYGMGWFIKPYRDVTLIQHGGNIDGFSLNLAMVPQANLGLVVLTNIEGRPLRDILTLDVIDEVLGFADGNWNTKFHGLWDQIYASQDQETEVADADRIPATTPSHPIDAYIGTYRADGYPDFKVKAKDGELLGYFGGEWTPLSHYHFDVFRLSNERFELKFLINFRTDNSGEIATVGVPMEPEVEDVVFSKAPPEVERELLAALAGLYKTPYEGLNMEIRSDGKQALILQFTGMTAQELIPARFTPQGIEFKVKDANQERVEFVAGDDETYTTAYYKQIGAVITTSRIEG